jgi:Threonyl-tRNA synthetase
VRDAGRRWIPLVAVVGDREVETKTVSLRRRWEPGRQEVVTLEELLEEVKRLNRSKP